MEEVAVRFPVLMINSLFGLPLDRAMELNQISSGMLLATAASPNGLTEAASLSAISRACGQRLGEILLEVIEEHRQTPRDDLVGMMLKASDSAEAPLNQAEMLANLRNLLPAGGETTSKGIGALLVGLLTAPEQLAKVRADRSLIPAAIEEAIRWESPDQFLFRVALRDSEIAGVSIPAGSGVTVCVGSANHDETVWEHPDEYDIDRPSRHHVGFSHGPHTCLGMRLARMELETLLNELLDRLPNLRLDPDQPTPTIRGTAFRSATTIPAIWD
jgi:cytochrome P450